MKFACFNKHQFHACQPCLINTTGELSYTRYFSSGKLFHCSFHNDTTLWQFIWLNVDFIAGWCFNTLRQRQNGRHLADNTFKPIFLNENIRILIKISLKFVPKVPINSIPALVQIMAWRQPDNNPLSGPMMVRLPTHICVTRPQWVKSVPILSQCWTACH